jgi:hypothetical protein
MIKWLDSGPKVVLLELELEHLVIPPAYSNFPFTLKKINIASNYQVTHAKRGAQCLALSIV